MGGQTGAKEMDNFFEKILEGYRSGVNPLLSKSQNEDFEALAKSMGIKRGSAEWNRFIWGQVFKRMGMNV